MQPTLKQLRYFVAAADAGSITGAARQLNISQPSVSAAIAEIEQSFALQLFVRHHAQGLSLTPAGQRLAIEARSLLAHAEELRQGALDLAGKPAGEVVVGCFQTFAPMVVPGLLRAVKQHYPDLGVRLREDHLEGLLDGLRHGRLDLALTYDLDLDGSLDFTVCAEVPLHVILAADHRLAARNRVALADLVEEPLVLLGLPHSRDYFLSVFRGLGLEPRVAHETPSFEMVRGLVANGYGYSVMHSRPESDQALDGRRLVYRPVREAVRAHRLGIARLAGSRTTRAAALFQQFCIAHFAAAHAAGGRRRSKIVS
ncbi:MAG: LysR family transcriptional regulator [Dongiaceae bacterium]